MAFGPIYTDLPLASATATRPATRYVDETSWSTLIGNFSLWGDNVNGNGKTLSNVVLSGSTSAVPLTITGINAGGADAITGLILDRVYGTIGDSFDIVWGAGSGMSGNRTARLSMNAVGGGEAGFIFYAQTGSGDGYSNEVMRVEGIGKVTLKSAASANTGYVVTDALRSFMTGINIGGLGSSYYQIYDITASRTLFACLGTDIKLYLGGSLKSLSVDGNGFVKAA